MKDQKLLILLLIVACIATVPTPVNADDDWPDSCYDAPTVDPTGEYSVTIDSPDDVDYFKVNLEKGEYIHFTMAPPTEQDALEVRAWASDSESHDVTIRNVQNAEKKTFGYASADHIVTRFIGQETSSWEMWAEGDRTQSYCVNMEDVSDDAEIPYTVNLNSELNNPEPATLEVGELRDQIEQKDQTISDLQSEIDSKEQTINDLQSEIDSKEQTINDLQSEIDSKEQTINDLQSEIDSKEQTINDLQSEIDNKEQTINDLETELESATEDVSISVSVEPADARQSFVEGGSAIVEASSDDADFEKLSLESNGQTFEFDSSGETRVPLESAGTQEMTLEYADTSESFSLNVQESNSGTTETSPGETDSPTTETDESDSDVQDSDGDGVIDSEDYAPNDPEVQEKSDLVSNETDESDSTGSGFGPGFGPVVALVGILLVTLGAMRRLE